MNIRKTAAALLVGMMALASAAGVAFAGHNGAVVTIDDSAACGETTFSATTALPGNTHHQSTNMRLVVHADGVTQVTGNIPTDGSSVSITVGPFFTPSVETKTIRWRVFGGAERDYDQPLWNGYGGATFTADINAYGATNGLGFVIAGPDDPNPFTTWHAFDVESCAPTTRADCMGGGWQLYGFRNQGDCISFREANERSVRN